MDKDERKELEEGFDRLQNELKKLYEDEFFFMTGNKEPKYKLNEIDE